MAGVGLELAGAGVTLRLREERRDASGVVRDPCRLLYVVELETHHAVQRVGLVVISQLDEQAAAVTDPRPRRGL
jgi:hypothetical protein